MKGKNYLKFLFLLLLPLVSSFTDCTDGESGYYPHYAGEFEISIDGRKCAVSQTRTVTLSGKISNSNYEDALISVYLSKPNSSEKPYLDFTLASDEPTFTKSADNIFTNSIADSEYSSVSRSFSVSFAETGEFWLVVEVTAECDGANLTPFQQIFPMQKSPSAFLKVLKVPTTESLIRILISLTTRMISSIKTPNLKTRFPKANMTQSRALAQFHSTTLATIFFPFGLMPTLQKRIPMSHRTKSNFRYT